jgi:two-component system nitrate/nitrite response regulator NarL
VVLVTVDASPTGPLAGGTLSIVVADDDDDMRRALREVLSANEGFTVVGDAADGHDLELLAASTGADMVLLDVRMPAGGADAARRLAALSPAPVVVAVSASTDVPTVVALLRAGARGFLAKGQLGRSFTEDLHRIARGQVMIAVPHAVQVLRALTEPA